MTRSTHLVVLCCLLGCGSNARGGGDGGGGDDDPGPPPDYGEPTGSTMIALEETGGFIATRTRGVQIVGTTASYHNSGRIGQATLPTRDVAAIVQALEDIHFLMLSDDYSHCPDEAADLPTATIDVELPAGAKTVQHSLGCTGGTFDQLAALEDKIFDLSGFSAWVRGD